jgi:hypothetical protein
MTWHTVTGVRGSEGTTGEWSKYPPNLARSRSIASPAQCQRYQLTRTSRLPVVNWTVAPAESHGLVRIAERRNLVSARVQSNRNYCVSRTPASIAALYLPIRFNKLSHKNFYNLWCKCSSKL